MTKPKRILLTGDVHGNTDWVIHHVLPQAKRHGCQLVLQLGDFGVWPGPEGQRYLDALSREAKGAHIPIWFIDGNHEDFDQLESLPLDEQERRPVRDHITHLPRGHRWEWATRTLLACGGASSIDVADRLPGRSWWSQEAITDQDVARCSEGGRVDILLTHDIQAEVPVADPLLEPALPPSVAGALSLNRQRLQRITEAVSPKLQVHGHWHLPYDRTITRSRDNEEVRIVSLTATPPSPSPPTTTAPFSISMSSPSAFLTPSRSSTEMRLDHVDGALMAMGPGDHPERVSATSLRTNLGATDRVMVTPGLTLPPVPTPGGHSGTGLPPAQNRVCPHPNRAAVGKERR